VNFLITFAGFAVSVWAAIGIGIFFIAMIIGCTFDRHQTEAPKWWILIVGSLTYVVWQWSNLSWHAFLARELWTSVGTYLLIGLAYSLLEFALEVRTAARYWNARWEDFKSNRSKGIYHGRTLEQSVVKDFIDGATGYSDSKRIIGISANKEGDQIEPKINRVELGESIGCWAVFWPFYAISLIIGDLFTEVFRIVADFLVTISGRAVRMAFRNVFKF
jgi:hypothetical protein